ncbi:MAG: S24 family peptidase [Porticoccaceae bacterium]|nr:S24 family peptidase [Porticoccaceae bacterium]
MDIHEIRRRNLRALIDKMDGGNDAAFGRRIERTRAQIGQYLSQSYNGGRSIGEKVARYIETELGLAPYALDGMQNVIAGPDIVGRLPLISWVRAGELCEAPDNFQPGDAEEWLDCPVKHGPNAYCLRVKGDSMDDGTADSYRDGEIIFVDPAIGAVAGHDVVVRTPDGKTTFKRLKQDHDGMYLLGLNGKKIIRVPEGTVFCGVVIFSGIKR